MPRHLRAVRRIALIAMLAVCGDALATFHLFVIDQLFSNADGTVQYVVFVQSPASNDEHEWMGHSLVSVHDGATRTFVYPSNLPSRLTRNKRVLVATQAFADLGLVAPDFIVPSGFLGTGAGRLKCCDDLDFTYTALPVDGKTALNGTRASVPAIATNFAGATAPVSVAAGAAGLDQNQHGLSGSWYEPATSGQGFEVEVFPAPGAGAGFVQVSWFTYDTTAGGADRQRWYTMSGAIGGSTPAALTIYRNVGGNFNAPPVTSATVVGTATLKFDSCTSGLLDYAFTDGSSRTGSIPLTRLTQNVTCASGAARPTNADFALSGNWYDAATAGQGFTVEANPVSSALFFAWYTYAPTGAASGAAGQRWLTGSAGWTPGARSLAVQIYETTGGVFDAPSVPPPASTAVGTGTLAFQSCASASLAYTITGGSAAGKSGAIALTRVGPVPAGCAF